MDHASGMKRAAPNADALNALALQRPRDQTPAPPQNVWRVLDNKAALHAGKADEASSAQPAGVQGEKVAVLHTVSTCPNQTDAGESKAVAVHVTGRSMSDIVISELDHVYIMPAAIPAPYIDMHSTQRTAVCLFTHCQNVM